MVMLGCVRGVVVRDQGHSFLGVDDIVGEPRIPLLSISHNFSSNSPCYFELSTTTKRKAKLPPPNFRPSFGFVVAKLCMNLFYKLKIICSQQEGNEGKKQHH